jgi:hypothetical protein
MSREDQRQTGVVRERLVPLDRQFTPWFSNSRIHFSLNLVLFGNSTVTSDEDHHLSNYFQRK